MITISQINHISTSWSDREPIGVDSYIKEKGHASGQVTPLLLR